jgi:hypothetical protein
MPGIREAVKEFLVKNYKHDRLYGRESWWEITPEKPEYGDLVVNSAVEQLTERGFTCISQYESRTGEGIWYVYRQGKIVVLSDDAEIKRLLRHK